MNVFLIENNCSRSQNEESKKFLQKLLQISLLGQASLLVTIFEIFEKIIFLTPHSCSTSLSIEKLILLLNSASLSLQQHLRT
jgi:hypothetical protein